MQFDDFSFGSIEIDGVVHAHDVIIDRGTVRKRKKHASKKFRGAFGHTPLSAQEPIPWKCRRLVIGTGAFDALPIMEELKEEARNRGIDMIILPTAEAIKALKQDAEDTNAVLHVTC